MMIAKEVEKCKSDLIQYYNEVLSGIQTDAFNPNSRIRFEDIYTNLYLLQEIEKNQSDNPSERHAIFAGFEDERGKRPRKHKQYLSYDEFRKLIQPGHPPFRILLVGEAGVGKTTFLAKLANDWTMGKDFKDIELLFRIPLHKAEKAKYFGDIVQKYISDATVYGARLDEYVRTHQSKIMVLLDGLDEFEGDITGFDENNSLGQIICGKKFKECIVIVTTRPWKGDRISNNSELEKKYAFVTIDGFTKENMKEYAGKFFHADQSMAMSLQQFIEEDNERGGVFSTIMAPFPIFLAMLCHVWKSESTRKQAMTLQSVSQLTNLMVYVLKEHYALKAEKKGYGKLYEERIHNVSVSLAEIGNLAYPHDPSVVTRPLIFDIETSREMKDSFETVCKLGLLTRDKTITPLNIRQREARRFITEYRIPHLMILDYLAAFYLTSLHAKSLPEFKSKLQTLIEGSRDDIDKFEYLWYFAVSQNKSVGRATMDVLSKEVKNTNFIVRTAFECHDKDITAPVMKLHLGETALRLDEKRSLPAYLYCLDTFQALVSVKADSYDPRTKCNISLILVKLINLCCCRLRHVRGIIFKRNIKNKDTKIIRRPIHVQLYIHLKQALLLNCS